MRVHDEIKRTLAAYQTLYESTVAYGMRKALHTGQAEADMRIQVSQLEQEKSDLTQLAEELTTRCDTMIKKDNDERTADKRKRTQEVQFLKRTNQQLKTQLEGVLAPIKK